MCVKKKYTFENGKRFLDRSGVRYGILTALSVSRYNERKQAFWNCLCDCGNETEVFGGNLNSGHTISCGCRKGRIKHGEAGKNRANNRTAEYQALACILQRCLNPNSLNWKDYGGRGIKVCPEWDSLEKFPAFLAYMGRRPSDAHSIDRINNAGNYEPGNVRWATWREQSRNTRRCVYLTFRGETLCRTDMAKKYGIKPDRLKIRLANGWSLHDALLKPTRNHL